MDLATPTANHLIPTFSLYGEDQWPTPDLLHWESVAQRSMLHNWQIKPHRHANLWQILLLENGSATAHVDGRDQILSLPCLLVIPQLCIHGFEFSPEIEGHVVTLAAPLVKSIGGNLQDAESLLYSPANIAIDNKGIKQLGYLFSNIATEYTQQNNLRDFSLQALVSQLLLWVVRDNTRTNSQSSIGNGKRYFAQFTQLIEQHFREQVSLDVYAKEIGISKPHLNSICRQLANCSALQIIHQRVLLEAKRNLIYTVMTVSEISNSLGFSEPPYFTRFFKRLTGQSPQTFRKQY